MDYKTRFLLNDLVKGERTFNHEVVEGRFNGFHLYNKLDPTSVVGVICVEGDRCYDVMPGSIELLESKDERIRKALMQNLKERFGTKGNMGEGLDMPDVLAWLEKQEHIEWKPNDKIQIGKKYKCIASPIYSTFMIGKIYKPEDKFLCSLMNFYSDCFEPIEDGKQKPTDKNQPKFKVGDYLVNDYCMGKVIELTDDAYLLDTEQGIPFSCEHNAHLWTIQDAQNGDVIFSNDGHGNDCIELIKSNTSKKIEFWFCLINNEIYEVFDGICPYTNMTSRQNATPATKEQRELLFQKLKEAGYEWDSEKKELKKIEQKMINEHMEWSLYDEKILSEIFVAVEINNAFSEVRKKEIISWLQKYRPYMHEKQLYIRFGDIPANEKSKIYRGDEEIGEEDGVSVYPAFESNGNIVIGLTLPITKTTLYTQQHLLEYDNRPCYLVSGDYVGKGADGEPLIKKRLRYQTVG